MSPWKIVFMTNKFYLKHYYRKTWINRQSVYLDFKIQAGLFINAMTFARKKVLCLF